MGYNLHEKSWVTVREDLKKSDTLIVPLGSLEAHGAHKPVGCCYLLADAVSKEVGGRTGITVTPVIPFGISDSYKNFPGTITVRSHSLFNYLDDVCKGLIRAGYRKIAFFSAHGGNNLPVLRDLSFKMREEFGALCSVIHIWGLIQRLTPAGLWDPDQRLGHGGEPTTSVMLHLYPELVDMNRAKLKKLEQPFKDFETRSYGIHEFKGVPQNIYLFAEEVEASGFMGDPTKASARKGELLYNRTVEYLVEYMNAFRRLDSFIGQED